MQQQQDREHLHALAEPHAAPKREEQICPPQATKREGTASQTVSPEQLDRRMESWQAATAYGEMGPGGINAIAGVLVQSSKEKISIYQAMMRGVLTPGTALVLLEAQAAIGFIVDPVKNKKVPVRDALAAGLTGGDYHGKLLSAERAVTGYTDPYTGNKISLFQAMERDLIVKDHGIRLLEAQIATGGIIDPVHSHRIPVEVAYKRGYFDQELNQVLSDPQNHSRSCFDPNTHENLTYMQLLSRCVPDPDTGLLMLQLMHKGSVLFQLDEKTRISLQSAPASVSVGLFQGQNVTVWELLFSRYVPDQKRQELLRKYKAGTLTVQEMTTIITALITEAEQKSSREPRHVKSPSTQRATSQNAEAARSQRDEKREKALKTTTVDGPGGEFQGRKVSVWDLLFSKYVLEEKRQELLKKYRAGTLTIQEMTTILTTSITEAEGKSRKLPTTKKTPSKETRTPSDKDKDAPSFEEQQTEKALKSTLVEVPAGEFHGRKVSVWDLLFSKYIPEEKRKELLQLHRAGILTTDQMKTIVTTIVSKTEEKSHHLPGHGESPNVETTTSEEDETPGSLCDKHLENALRSETVDIPVGEFKWQEASLWELLFSSYISEINRQELLKKYRAGMLTIQEMITILTTSVTEAEGKSRKLPTTKKTPSKETRTLSEKDKDAPSFEEQQTEKALKSTLVEVPAGEFHGRKVSVWDLLFSKYIPEEKRKELLQLHRAGILTTDQMKTIVTTIVSKTEEKSHHLPGHGENPSVEMTTSEEDETPGSLCDKHLENTLRSETVDIPVGEFKWQELSLWELLFSSYISEINRQELLKKYRAGTLTIQEMITILTTSISEAEGKSRKLPTTKKTPSKETRTPSEKDKDAPSFEEQQTEKALKSTLVEVPAGEFHGRKVSVWDLLFSKYIPEEKRKELLQLHRAGILTTDQMKTIVTTIVSKTEEKSHHLPGHGESPNVETTTSEEDETPGSLCDKHLENALRSETVDIPVGEFKWQEASLWELLFSSYISEINRQELLKKYRAGMLTIQEMITILTTSVTEAEGKSRKLPTTKKTPSKETRTLSEKDKDAPSFEEQQTEKALKSTLVEVPAGEFHGRKVSVWDLLFSKYIPEEKRKELLQLHRAGILTTDQMKTIVTTIVSKTEEKSHHLPGHGENPSVEMTTSEEDETPGSLCDKHLENTLRSETVDIPVGEFKWQELSLWELLFSSYISEINRQELLKKYRAGTLTIQEMITILTTSISEAEGKSRKLPTTKKTPSKETRTPSEKDKDAPSFEEQQTEKALKSTLVEVPAGEFHGRKVSVWDLLFSKYIPEEKRKELLQLHRAGILTTDQMKTIVTTIVSKTEEKSHHLPGHGESPNVETTTSEEDETPGSLCDKHLENALRSETVDIPVGEFKWQEASLWELLFSSYISEINRQELLKKYRAGMLTIQEMITILTTSVTEAEGKSRKLPTTKKTPSKETRTLSEKDKDAPSFEEQQTEKALKSTLVEVPAGEFHGRKVSVWDLLFSKYIPEEKRKELLQLHRAGILTTNQMKTIVTTIVSKTEEKSHHLPGHGENPSVEMTTSEEDETPGSLCDKHLENTLRSETVSIPVGEFKWQEVSLWDLLFSSYISEIKRQELLKKYRAGMLTIQEMITILTTSVTEVEKGSRNLCINTEVPSKVGVTSDKAEDAHSQEKHLRKSLKRVTIYVNAGEFQGQNVSLLDLLFSKYILQEKRQELLALYRARVLTIEQMIPIITSIITTTEDTSRQFMTSVKSPNREEITSQEAVVAHSPQDTQLDNILKATTIDGPVSGLQDQKVSVWDLLFSNYIPEEKRQELLELYRAGILTTDQVITVITTLIRKKEATSRKFVINVKTPSKDTMTLEKAEDVDLHEEKKLEKALKSTMVDVPAGEFHKQKVSVWDLLFSNYIPEEKRQELLELYRAGILTMDQVITVVTSIVTKIGTTRRKLETNVHSPSAERAPLQEADAAYSMRNEDQEMALKSTTVGPVGEFQGPKVSVWDLLFSKYVPKETRQELLEKHRAGTLTTEKMITSLTTIVSHALEEGLSPDNQQILNLLQSEASYVTVGPFQDQRVSVWELLSSKCVSQYNREVHLDTYNAGRLAVNEITITTTVITGSQGKKGAARNCEQH